MKRSILVMLSRSVECCVPKGTKVYGYLADSLFGWAVAANGIVLFSLLAVLLWTFICLSDWGRYHALIIKRQAETLTQDEYQELISTSDRLEKLNVQRIQSLIQLAKLRQQTLSELMESLGINSNPDVLDYA